MISFRPAEPADIAALQGLDTVAQHDPHRVDDIVRWVLTARCLCAVEDGIVLGYAVVDHTFFHQPMLEMVMVEEAARGRGIGGKLVAAAMETVQGPVLWSSTNQSNQAMQRLFAGLGFARSGYVEGLDEGLDEGDPELIYRSLRNA